LGTVVGAGLFAVQYALSRGRWIGGGDIRLGGVLGLSLGWPLVAVCLALAYFSGSVVAAVLLLTKRKGWSSLLPFGTFLSLAGVITIVWGQAMLDWYLRGGFFDWVVNTLLRFYNPVA
jgi:prepilin signal peptidase PulO-like enzyme (type II secretory pathway)